MVALGAAVLLAAGLLYTSFSASSEAKQPSELLAGDPGSGSYQLTGVVVPGSVPDGPLTRFQVADRDDPSARMPVRYTGQVPDPFREGREVILTGTVEDGVFVADKDSLITKCPSKFADEAEEDPEHVVIE